MAAKRQIKSKERVVEHGEVFTNEREVNAMLDLVKIETERLDSRFLEPACGDGNFLAEVLRRKLVVAKKMSGGSRHDFEKNSLIALMSIYGVELMKDNAEECRARMYKIWNEAYTSFCKTDSSDEIRVVARFLLQRNILCGNALTLKRVDEACKDMDVPIIFSEWSFVTGDRVKRRDFRLDQLLTGGDENFGQLSLFDEDANSANAGWEYDDEIKAFLPGPTKEFVAKDYRRLPEDGE